MGASPHIMIKRKMIHRGAKSVRIAIATEGNRVSQKFEKCMTFTIFEVLKGRVAGKMKVDVSASNEQNALLYILSNEKVEVLLCSEIGEKVKEELEEYDIKVITGLKGNASVALKAYLKSIPKSQNPEIQKKIRE